MKPGHSFTIEPMINEGQFRHLLLVTVGILSLLIICSCSLKLILVIAVKTGYSDKQPVTDRC